MVESPGPPSGLGKDDAEFLKRKHQTKDQSDQEDRSQHRQSEILEDKPGRAAVDQGGFIGRFRK